MKQLYFICVIIIISILVNGCKPALEEGFTASRDGYRYKYITIGEQNIQAHTGDLVELKLSFNLNHRYILNSDSSYKNEIGLDTISITKNNTIFLKALCMLSEGDSCVFKFNGDENFIKRIKSFKKEDTITAYVAIKHIKIKANISSTNKHYDREEEAIARFIKHSNYHWYAMPDGLYYTLLNEGKGDNYKAGEKVRFNYKGSYLNGVVFDNYSSRNPYFDWTIGTQNQLIRGMELAIQHLKPKEEALFIIPYNLAFGAQGSSTFIVPPDKTVLFHIIMMDIPKS